MTSKQRPRVLWLTNLPAPYRFAIWARIAEKLDLKVSFLLKEKNYRNWTVPSNMNWKYEYLSLNSKKFGEFDLIPSFRVARRLLHRVDLVVVGGWEAPFYLRTVYLAKRLKIPIIQFYESTVDSHRFNNRFICKIRSVVFSQADYIVTAGIASTRAVQAMGVAPEKIVTLFNPVDVSWFHTFALSHRIPQALGHRFIYVGQLISRKNVAEVIRAFAYIKTNEDTLTIAGDGPLAGALKDLARALGVEDSVSFTGHKSQEELAALYAASHTLILASTNEVWGLVVNEALASGLHVVVSDKCGVADFVKEMKGTYICQTDQKSIQESMENSRKEWTGHIQDPEILQFTPKKFADELLGSGIGTYLYREKR
jgi:glycosyltransferase involved in cell wall biosynthesis